MTCFIGFGMSFVAKQSLKRHIKPGFCNGRGFEKDVTFDHKFYTGADPESFDGRGM